MIAATLSRFKLLYKAIEMLIGPLVVFIISYSHHIYFADTFASSFFAAISLLSLLFVVAVDKTGIFLALGLQLAFLGWVAVLEPKNLTEQALFSASISLALFASYINHQQEVIPDVPVDEKKDKLWQELFDARQEIKTLYAAKEEIQAKVAEDIKEKANALQLLQHELEASRLEKESLVEDAERREQDIQKFASHMHEMALYQETLRQEVLRLEESMQKPALPKTPEAKASHYESMYHQLKQQFEEKAQKLDVCRKELFEAQEVVERLNRSLQEMLEPTAEERRLMQELVGCQDKIDALNRAHDEELVGYEEVIQGLLNQLHEKSTTSSNL